MGWHGTTTTGVNGQRALVGSGRRSVCLVVAFSCCVFGATGFFPKRFVSYYSYLSDLRRSERGEERVVLLRNYSSDLISALLELLAKYLDHQLVQPYDASTAYEGATGINKPNETKRNETKRVGE